MIQVRREVTLDWTRPPPQRLGIDLTMVGDGSCTLVDVVVAE